MSENFNQFFFAKSMKFILWDHMCDSKVLDVQICSQKHWRLVWLFLCSHIFKRLNETTKSFQSHPNIMITCLYAQYLYVPELFGPMKLCKNFVTHTAFHYAFAFFKKIYYWDLLQIPLLLIFIYITFISS